MVDAGAPHSLGGEEGSDGLDEAPGAQRCEHPHLEDGVDVHGELPVLSGYLIEVCTGVLG